METFIVRVWLPDRPGVLGAVASRIGAVRGDVVGIDILERGAGRAIDELVVQLPDASLVDLLVGEVGQVDGVDVEDVRPAPAQLVDPRLDALETAAVLVSTQDQPALLATLVGHARRDLGAEWSVVVDVDDKSSASPLLACEGLAPPPAWLAAFVGGSRSSAAASAGECGPDDVAWAPLDEERLALVLGRHHRPFRARERQQLGALARVADAWRAELVRRDVEMARRQVELTGA